ncbi:hypothetical protein GIB67_030113 [Kingdonia uniflora]|uniref:Uncharacterized protein n=1 Tax=Kingdonia uniflora TaxID=39325 RepID=A0A7J7L2P8_9MAGN|nr:hypothetical protein GIB67_030113 [Kingdonia uniflora]
MAHCYKTEQLHMLEDAIKCYKRAANCNDREAIALHQLAKLHKELGRDEEAVFYFKKDIEKMENEERKGPNMVEALLFLATHCRIHMMTIETEVYCNRLLDYNGPEVDIPSYFDKSYHFLFFYSNLRIYFWSGYCEGEKETAKSILRGMGIEQSPSPSPSPFPSTNVDDFPP